MDPNSYPLIFILGIFFAFLDAFGIGANDVANSFATSVGSKTLTIGQACLIAIFTEFGGAVLLGAETASTIRNSIINIKGFAPNELMLGFLSSLIASSFWVLLATRFGWPVSTTHSIVGAICGFGIARAGTFDVLNWPEMTKIFISWVASPGIAGILGAIVFMITKVFILDSTNSLRRGIFAIPFYFVIALSVCTFFVINKAPKGIDLSKAGTPENWTKVFIYTGIGAAIYLIFSLFFLVPFFRRMLIDEEDLKAYHLLNPFLPKQPKNTHLEKDMHEKLDHARIDEDVEAAKPKKNAVISALTKGVTIDVVTARTERMQKAHDRAIKFDPKTEYLFSLLQVCTAAFASFAHGSNDVANAGGPLSAIYAIYDTGKAPAKNVPVPFWILAVMGLAIDAGLVLYGYNVMRTLGNNITYHSPSRGFSMEFSAAMTVITASFIGIPVSTTHCITGSTIGVGLCNFDLGAINWRMVSWTLFSWVLTLPIAGGISALAYIIFKGTL